MINKKQTSILILALTLFETSNIWQEPSSNPVDIFLSGPIESHSNTGAEYGLGDLYGLSDSERIYTDNSKPYIDPVLPVEYNDLNILGF